MDNYILSDELEMLLKVALNTIILTLIMCEGTKNSKLSLRDELNKAQVVVNPTTIRSRRPPNFTITI
jgi:hypothetical protein